MTVQFKRGEVRTLSIQTVERNSAEPFETVVELVSEQFGWQKGQARTHIRWLVREGLVNKTEGILAWPKRARKEKAAVTAATTKTKKVKGKLKTAKTKSKSTRVAKTTDVVAEKTVEPKADTGVTNGMNKSMTDLAKKFMKFREEKKTETAAEAA